MSDTPTPLHAQVKRRQGRRLTNAERKAAQEVFLDAFRLNANVTAACGRAAISRDTFYQWLEHDEAFSVLYHQAELAANDVLLAAAWRRAVSGVEKAVVSMGKPVFVDGKVLMEREYSDSVLLRLMSWRIPGFREKQHVEVTGKDGGPIETRQAVTIDLAALKDATPEDLALLKKFALEQKEREG